MSAWVHTLASGEALPIRIVEPPLGDLTDRVEYRWRDIREPSLAGDLADTSLDRFVLGEPRGQVAGSMTYATPRDTRDVAVLGMVWTRPDQRRNGIARALRRLGRRQPAVRPPSAYHGARPAFLQARPPAGADE